MFAKTFLIDDLSSYFLKEKVEENSGKIQEKQFLSVPENYNTCFLGIGSNLGDKYNNILKSLEMINQVKKNFPPIFSFSW